MTTVTKKDINSFFQKAGLDVLQLINYYYLQFEEERNKIEAFERQKKKICLQYKKTDAISKIIHSIVERCVFEYDINTFLLKITRPAKYENAFAVATRVYISFSPDFNDIPIMCFKLENDADVDIVCELLVADKIQKIYTFSFYIPIKWI